MNLIHKNIVDDLHTDIGLLVQAFAEACGFPWANTMVEVLCPLPPDPGDSRHG